MSGYTYSGVSGRSYSYLLFSPENLGNLPMQGGNYIFALNNAERTPIFIEATNSVHAAVARQGIAEWKVAQTVHGVELVLIHVDPDLDMGRRQAEKTDLIGCYFPPMNPMPDPS